MITIVDPGAIHVLEVEIHTHAVLFSTMGDQSVMLITVGLHISSRRSIIAVVIL